MRWLVLGLIVGLFMGFVDSYGYAVSGFTISEISIVFIPLITLFLARCMGVTSLEEIIYASSLAIGIDLTTTLTSGMYLTYGYLQYLSSKLRVFGFEIRVPQTLFSDPNPIDFEALPTYVSLSLASMGGALLAYALRMHYLDKERLTYPLGLAASMVLKIVRTVPRSCWVGLGLGFALQLLVMYLGLDILDLTPLVGSYLPGAVFALALNPLVYAVAMLLPLGALRGLAMGSMMTYVAITTLSVALLGAYVPPLASYDDVLLAVSNIVASCMVGLVTVATVSYLTKYYRVFLHSAKLLAMARYERFAATMGTLLVASMVLVALSISRIPIPKLLSIAAIIVPIHLVLVLVNLRIVGEVGMGSQAVLPLATSILVASRCSDVATYAALDPFTGIPMPQVIGGTSMNLARLCRACRASVSKAFALLCLGIALGSIPTYIYGNLLVNLYGFDSPQMPMHRWIPTIVWMATIYSGRSEALYPQIVALGFVLAILLLILSQRFGIPFLPLIVGTCIPPDVGIAALVAYVVKSIVLKLGVELHEKTIVFSTFVLLGCGLGVALNSILVALLA